jgi:NAD(P)-dependent dehydrogenase (short-subunit alcohol dehydrogenase family)
VIATREALPLLKEAGGEHRKALIVNTASIAGKAGQPWISVYSATKFGVVGFSEATEKEVGRDGIQVTALCPGFVDTAMTEWVRGQVPPEAMIRPEDIGEAVRMLLRTSPNCHVPEIMFLRPGEAVGTVG